MTTIGAGGDYATWAAWAADLEPDDHDHTATQISDTPAPEPQPERNP